MIGLILFLAAASNVVDAAVNPPATFVVDLEPILGTESGVTGTMAVFAHDDTTIAYAGVAEGLAANLQAADCAVSNGCGVHIHAGTDCTNETTQMGHFFVDPVTEDPWTEERYTTDASGVGRFAGLVNQGSSNVLGLAVSVHDQDGTRVACGILEDVTEETFTTLTESLSGSGVNGVATVIQDDDMVCFYGTATGLERDLVSVRADDTSEDCMAENGCGVHVHDGMDCTDSGHWYNEAALNTDPWVEIGYLSTDSNGNGYFVDCVETGETDSVDGRAFSIHANDGSRVSCGLFGPPPSNDVDETPASDTSDAANKNISLYLLLVTGTMTLFHMSAMLF